VCACLGTDVFIGQQLHARVERGCLRLARARGPWARKGVPQVLTSMPVFDAERCSREPRLTVRGVVPVRGSTTAMGFVRFLATAGTSLWTVPACSFTGC